MDIITSKSTEDLLKSLIAEQAKASNELRCAQKDIDKIQSRLSFCMVVINELVNRKGD